MCEAHIAKLEIVQVFDRYGIFGLRIPGNRENRAEVLERYLRLTIGVDDVAELLKRTEDEEGVDQEREELADSDLLREDQVKHQEENRRPQQVDECPLNEAETSQVTDLFQLELEDLVGCGVEAPNFLVCETETFHKLDV